jgi:hypothetical protein
MKKLLAFLALSPLLTGAAHAQLFTPGSPITVDLTNSPNTTSTVVPLTPGNTAIDSVTNLNVNTVATAGGGEWVVFTVQTNGSVPLSQPSQFWEVNFISLDAAVQVNFDQVFASWLSSTGGSPPISLPQTSAVFGPCCGYALESNPVPGSSATTGEGKGGFTDIFGPGTSDNFLSDLSPFGQITGAGLDPADVTGYYFALHFDPTTASGVPEPSTWAMMLTGFGLLGFAAMRKGKREARLVV